MGNWCIILEGEHRHLPVGTKRRWHSPRALRRLFQVNESGAVGKRLAVQRSCVACFEIEDTGCVVWMRGERAAVFSPKCFPSQSLGQEFTVSSYTVSMST
jgi:hypothetical protein